MLDLCCKRYMDGFILCLKYVDPIRFVWVWVLFTSDLAWFWATLIAWTASPTWVPLIWYLYQSLSITPFIVLETLPLIYPPPAFDLIKRNITFNQFLYCSTNLIIPFRASPILLHQVRWFLPIPLLIVKRLSYIQLITVLTITQWRLRGLKI